MSRFFNPADKARYPKGFSAVKWLISKAEMWNKETKETEWGRVTDTDASFEGNLPWHMKESLDELRKSGYCNEGNQRIGNLVWYSKNTEHSLWWEFGEYRSTQRKVKFGYMTSTYHDGFPEDFNTTS